MLWNAKNASVKIGESEMSYVSFGSGERSFVILPGLSDGLTTVKGKALMLAKPYKNFFDRYTVYMFSRKEELPESYSISEMANDQAQAMRLIGLHKACVMGVSEGGMIAQSLAIEHPDLVEKLVIAVSAPKVNPMIEQCITRWMEYAKNGDHRNLMIDTAERCYSESYLKKFRKVYPFLGAIGRPKDYRRFLTNAYAIMSFDVSNRLSEISCPTLILAGEEDKVVGVDASYEMNKMISGSKLFVYKGLGHSAYEEAKDFNDRVLEFLDS